MKEQNLCLYISSSFDEALMFFSSKSSQPSWFAVRTELSGKRRLVMMTLSFVMPVVIWCMIAYLPYFHVNNRLLITSSMVDSTVNYTPGESMPKSFFPEFQEKIRKQNADIRSGEYQKAKENKEDNSQAAATFSFIQKEEKKHDYHRENLLKLRFMTPILKANNWLEGVDITDAPALDKRIYEVFGDLAEGRKTSTGLILSDENMVIIKDNWKILNADASLKPDEVMSAKPLLYLIPQGVSAPPKIVPPPHSMYESMAQQQWLPSGKELNELFESTTGIEFKNEDANQSGAGTGNDAGGDNQAAAAETETVKKSMGIRLIHSMMIVFTGFLLAALIGVPLAIICGSYDVFSKLFEPFTDFFRYMPAPTFSIILITLFGVHDWPKISLVFIGTFPHLLLMLSNTTRQLDRSLLEAAQTLGAKPASLVVKVILPGVLPKVYDDLRVLLGWAWTWLVIAELIGTKSGLTEFIDIQSKFRNYEALYPVIIMIGVIGFSCDQLLQSFSRYLFPWENTKSKRSLFRQLTSLFESKPKTAVATVSEGNSNQSGGSSDD